MQDDNYKSQSQFYYKTRRNLHIYEHLKCSTIRIYKTINWRRIINLTSIVCPFSDGNYDTLQACVMHTNNTLAPNTVNPIRAGV